MPNNSFLARSAGVLVVQGEEEARKGDVEAAIEKFRQVQKWNPQLSFDAQRKARELEKEAGENF